MNTFLVQSIQAAFDHLRTKWKTNKADTLWIKENILSKKMAQNFSSNLCIVACNFE